MAPSFAAILAQVSVLNDKHAPIARLLDGVHAGNVVGRVRFSWAMGLASGQEAAERDPTSYRSAMRAIELAE